MADRVGHADCDTTEQGDQRSPGMEEGSLVRSKDEWGSIIDILHSIENTTQPSKPVPPTPSPAARLAPLSENIQAVEMAPSADGRQGQGLQQLDHLVRMMEQMCHLQKQNSRLREQTEYLNAIKDLQELRNESLVQNCKCEAQRHSSDLRGPDETFSEPESTVGDEMDTKRDSSPTRETRRASRSIKREPKIKGGKKRSRSLDPYRKDTTEPGEKDTDRERERGRPGIFSKFERMKEKLTTRRGSVKKHNTNKRMEDKQEEDVKANLFRPDPSSNEHFNLQMDGTETKSEDSGIFHVGLDEIVSLPRLAAELLPKSPDELSDNEDVFTPLQPSWNQTNNFSMETRKGSDFSTGSSSEDYLDLKPKRTAPQLPQDDEPVVMRSPEQQRRRGDSEERAEKSSDEKENNVRRKMRVRRSASLQDNTSLNSDDDEFEKPAKTAWEVKEAPAVLQSDNSGRQSLQNSPSYDFEFSDASLDMHTGPDSASTSSLESKAAQKRKYFRKSHRVEEPTSPTTDQRFKVVAFEMRSPKSSPPEKKRHKVGWEKVKHAVTRKHIGDISKTKGTVSMDESLLRSSEEPSSPTDSSPPEDTLAGGKVRRLEVKKGDPKREKERGPPPQSSSTEAQSPLAIYESLQANLSEDFAKKMEKWDKKKQRHGATGASPLEKAKQSSMDSCSSEAGTLPTSDLEAELQRGLTEDFYKKLAEWDKLRNQKGGGGAMSPNSPRAEPKQKQKGAKEGKKAAKGIKGTSKEKERDKSKTRDVGQRSKSPDASAGRKISPPTEAIYATENITVFAKQGGKLKLEGASKEFSKKYKEWEKKEKKKKNFPPLKTEEITTPVFDHAQALPPNFRDDATPPTPSSPTTNESTERDSGDLYVIAHATPVIVEPVYDNGDARIARAGEPIFRTQSAPPGAAAHTLNAVPQGERPSSQRVASNEDEVFAPGVSSSPPIPQERVDRLEQRNSFLAEQLKLDDVNLLAVQEEIVNMDEQIAEISGEKPEDRTDRRVSTCSSIGESALEAELSDIKMQIAQLEENLRKRPRHKGQHGVKGSDGVKGHGEVNSSPEADRKSGESTESADFTPLQLHAPTVEAQKKGGEEPTSEAETSFEAEVHSNLTEALEKSLQEREAIIKLLQARVDRQAQEINYLKSGGDMANLFKRAKSFTARDKKTFDPRAMKVVDILIEKPELNKVKMLSDDQSESSKSLKTDSTPSLETLHISAEDITIDDSTLKKQDKVEPSEDEKSMETHPSQSVEAKSSKVSEMAPVDNVPPAQVTDVKKAEEEYPGLYGPIETKLKRRRSPSSESRPRPEDTQDTHATDGSTTEASVTDSHAAVDSLLAKKIEGSPTEELVLRDGSISPRLKTRTGGQKDCEDKGPVSPSATSKKVTPKFELVKLADGLKSQAVELSPRTQRRRERESKQDAKRDGKVSPRSPREGRRSPGESQRASPQAGRREKSADSIIPRGKQESGESFSHSKHDKEERSSPNRPSRTTEHTSPKGEQPSAEKISQMKEIGKKISQRLSSRDEETKQDANKDEEPKIQEQVKEEKQVSKDQSSAGQAESRRETSPEKQWDRKAKTGRTLSPESEPTFRSSNRERGSTPTGREKERRPSVENLRAAIERRQRSFSSDTADSDLESPSNAKKALEIRLSGRIGTERRDSSDSAGSNKQFPLEGKREPVLMRGREKKEDKSVSSLRRRFVTQEFGSTPNVTELSSLLAGRKEKERPREGCVKQISQAFAVASLSEQGASDIRRSSKSSSVRSSPQSLSPASSTSSLSNIVASQIKRLQDKASSSPESPERRTSIQNKGTKDTVPSLYSLHGRLEHRQSLTNIADVRAKFDKKTESSTTSDSSPIASRTSSPARNPRRDPAKPTLVPSVAAARIKYTVSVSNSENSRSQSNSENSRSPKKSVSPHQNGSTKSQRRIAVVESSQAEKSTKSDSTVTFTINQNQKRRQNTSRGASRLEENNNNSNNNNRNFSGRAEVRRKGSSANQPDASNRPNKKQEENENQGATRKNSFSRNDKRRGSLPRQTESRESSRRGSLTKGKESPKAQARRTSISKGKESPKNGSRRNSMTKARDSSNESSKGKIVSKDKEPSKDASSLRTPGSEQDEDERSRRRRRRRERNTTPEPPRPESKTEMDKPEVKASDVKSVKEKIKTGSEQDVKENVKGEIKRDAGTDNKPKANSENKQSSQSRVKSENKPEVKQATPEAKQDVKPKVKPEVKPEVKPTVKPEVKPEAKPAVKPEVKPEAKPEAKPEVKPDRAQERRNRREERARRQKEREDEASKAKEEAARQKAEAARAKLKQEMEAARVKEEEAARLKAEKQTEEATKKASRVERRESKRAERRGTQREKSLGATDTKKTASPSDLMPSGSDTSTHSIRRRQSKREEQKPSQVSPASQKAAKPESEEEDPNMPDLLAQAQKKASAESATGEEGRSPRAILTNSALRGAEAVIGHALPKSPPPEEEEPKEDAEDDRRSRKDATRRSRAINRGSRISRLDIFKRARSVDSSKASKERSPDRLLGGGGASSRACSMDRSGKNRDKSPGGEETRKGGSWLSKRTGSISNFLRPSNCHDMELWDELDECYCILQSCASIYRPAYEYEDMCQLRCLRETSILT